MKNMENDFVVPAVRIWTRIVCGVLFAGFLGWSVATGIKVDYRAESRQEPGTVKTLAGIEDSADGEKEDQVADPSPPKTTVSNPTDVPKNGDHIEEVIANNSVTPAEPQQVESPAMADERKPAALANSPVSTALPAMPASIPVIIAGETAPAYEMAESHRQVMVDRFGGRYIVTDGTLSVDLGKSLANPSVRVIDGSWHHRYATRMIAIGRNHSCDAAISACRIAIPQLQSHARVFVSVPHTVDLSILEAQKQFLGLDDWDVHATTIVELRGGGFVVTGTLPQQ